MKIPRSSWPLLAALVVTSAVSSADEPALPPKEKVAVYLLMGQSNMAGRGRMTDEDRKPRQNIFTLDKTNKVQSAKHPLHFDKPKIAGVGLGIPFAEALRKGDDSISVLLVPCAFGGTPLRRWVKGGDLYERAVQRAKVAQKSGQLSGVLWHQGESDSGAKETADSYAGRLDQMIADLRKDLDAPNLPFVAGQLGEFYVEGRGKPHASAVNSALTQLPKRVANTGCASAAELKHKGDVVHFSADALRELGKRYASEMTRIARKQE